VPGVHCESCFERARANAVHSDAEAKAEQAATDLLAELGLEELEGPSSSASKVEEGEAACSRRQEEETR